MLKIIVRVLQKADFQDGGNMALKSDFRLMGFLRDPSLPLGPQPEMVEEEYVSMVHSSTAIKHAPWEARMC